MASLSDPTGCSPIPAQVEDYLKEVTKNAEDDSGGSAANTSTAPLDEDDTHAHEFDFAGGQQPPPHNAQDYAPGSFDMPDMSSRGGQGTAFGDSQLMGLGISETLPPFEVMEELYDHQPTHMPETLLTLAYLAILSTSMSTTCSCPSFIQGDFGSRSMVAPSGNRP